MAGSEHRNEILDVDVTEVWSRLESEPGAVLIDVRTQAEWAFVGVPDLASLGKPLLCVEWQGFPGSQLNAAFVDQLDAEFAALGVSKSASLFFICRSGSRSLHAARAMANAGYHGCQNVAAGFEGSHDESRHRGTVSGWKSAGLPWTQG